MLNYSTTGSWKKKNIVQPLYTNLDCSVENCCNQTKQIFSFIANSNGSIRGGRTPNPKNATERLKVNSHKRWNSQSMYLRLMRQLNPPLMHEKPNSKEMVEPIQSRYKA